MSQENVELVRSIYAALNRGDWDAATRPTDADFEVTFQRGPNAGIHRGRDSIQAIIEDQREAFDEWIIEVEQVFDSGDQVVALIKSRLRRKSWCWCTNRRPEKRAALRSSGIPGWSTSSAMDA